MLFILILCIAPILYTWFAYPSLLRLFCVFFSIRTENKPVAPFLSILVTVHNEEKLLARRMENLLSCDYPKDLVEFVVVSDGSTDNTGTIAREFGQKDSRVKLVSTPGGGKSAAQNIAIPRAKGEVVVLTDADTLFDQHTLVKLVQPFSDPRVGCTTGRLVLGGQENAVARNQGFYWRFEMFLRRAESALGLLHTASGSVMAFRKSLFAPFECEYGDDCVIPLDIRRKGHLVIHVDEATAMDAFPSEAGAEFAARKRMTLRNLTCTMNRLAKISPLRHPGLFVAIVSHKILRWLTPFFMILAFAANVFLVGHGALFDLLFLGQVLFYGLALIGWFGESRGVSLPLADSAFSFVLACAGFFMGVCSVFTGRTVTSYRNK